MREFWREEGFIEIHTPKFMGSASESGAELFKVEYFDRDAYLAQSPQFYKQMAMAAGFGKRVRDRARVPRQPVVHLAPRHRVHERRRGDLLDRLARGRDGLRGGAGSRTCWRPSRRRTARRSKQTFDTEVVVPAAAVPARSRSREAKELLREHGHDAPGRRARPRPAQRARAVGARSPSAHGHEFAFVTDYPTTVRPFYHMRHAERPDSDEELRPAVARHRDHDRRPARAPLRAARSRRREDKRRRRRADPVLPRLLPLRRAAARRLRLRADAPADADAAARTTCARSRSCTAARTGWSRSRRRARRRWRGSSICDAAARATAWTALAGHELVDGRRPGPDAARRGADLLARCSRSTAAALARMPRAAA